MSELTDIIRSIPGFDGRTDGENEYMGADGLIYCAKCRTPKQTRMNVLGEERVIGHLCRCEADVFDREEQERKARKQRERVNAWRAQGLSVSRWHTHTFANDDRRDSTASGICRNYAYRFDQMLSGNRGLLMYGGVGCGKTYLAAAIANELVEQGRYVLMDTLPGLIARMTAEFGSEREYWLGKIAKAHLMVIDDFGVERSTEFATETAYEIINARYRANKPLIVTTNLSLEQMGAESGVGRLRIYDRIREMCAPLLVAGESRRKTIARQMRREMGDLLGGADEV